MLGSQARRSNHLRGPRTAKVAQWFIPPGCPRSYLAPDTRLPRSSVASRVADTPLMDAFPTTRRRVYEILEVARPGDTLSRVVDISLVSLVAVNVLAVVLNSVDDLVTRHEAVFEVFEFFP